MNCHVSKGDLPVKIRWLFNGQIPTGPNVITQKIGTRTSLLTIPNVLETHDGNYTCVAINAAGFANHTATLHVKSTCYFVICDPEDLSDSCLSRSETFRSLTLSHLVQFYLTLLRSE